VALAGAHKGYIYQDLVCACLLVDAICLDTSGIVVDSKLFEEDKFDDLTIYHGDTYSRYQFKHSVTQELDISDLRSGRISIAEFLTSFLKEERAEGSIYNLILSWDDADQAIHELIASTVQAPSLPFPGVTVYKLNPEALWPVGSKAQWEEIDLVGCERGQFIDFCDRFKIEVNWPKASLDLSAPGPLETYLLTSLRNRLGIGEYPNEHLDPVDLASTLIRFVTLLRAQDHRVVTLSEIYSELRIRTDFGAIHQPPLIKSSEYIDLKEFNEFLLRKSKENKVTILTGSPGSGKSWATDKLYHSLLSDGGLVARHYCYLSPNDDNVEVRVKSDTLFGNLISGLLEIDPHLSKSKEKWFASNADELETILTNAKKKYDGPIILIVDGLDHIQRVYQESRTLSATDINIIEQLSILQLPDNINLVVASQPGSHLDPLKTKNGYEEICIPTWSDTYITSLGEKLLDPDEYKAFTVSSEASEKLCKIAQGNPLYAGYLLREYSIELARNPSTDSAIFFSSFPELKGDITRYYDFLASNIRSELLQRIPAVLSLIDFSVNHNDLSEIFPDEAHMIKTVISKLSPVLLVKNPTIGYRIYHESFRRYILQELREEGADIESILRPVIDWLESKGFYDDSVCYKNLLLLLGKANRYDRVKELVDSQFASRSISFGHSRKAISDNITSCARYAANTQDWPFMARLSEIRRAAYTCFEDHFYDGCTEYGITVLEFLGAERFATRLIYQGEPTYDVAEGLYLCSRCQFSGGSPPWELYIEEYEKLEDESLSADCFSALLHGYLVTKSKEEALSKLATCLEDNNFNLPNEHISVLSDFLIKIGSIDFLVDSLLEDPRCPSETKRIVRKKVVSYHVKNNNYPEAEAIVHRFASSANDKEIAYYLQLGLHPSLEGVAFSPLTDINVLHESVIYEERPIRISQWFDSLTLTAAMKPELVDAERAKIHRAGWYGNWLVYMTELSALEVSDQKNKSQAVAYALEKLAQDCDPFAGKPRACDLYSIRDPIKQSFSRGLKLLGKDRISWKKALESLVQISEGTTTYLQGSPSGPLELNTLLVLLEEYSATPEIGDIVVQTCRELADTVFTNREFFAQQSSVQMQLCRILSRSGLRNEVSGRLKEVGKLLTAYGHHKDITILEIVDTLSCFRRFSTDEALSNARKVLPLVNSVHAHTDGKDTRHISNSWFSQLSEIHLPSSIDLLASVLSEEGGRIDWRLESAVQSILNELSKGEEEFKFYCLFLTVVLSERHPSWEPILKLFSKMGYLKALAIADRLCLIYGNH
jgi:hypothetical protein